MKGHKVALYARFGTQACRVQAAHITCPSDVTTQLSINNVFTSYRIGRPLYRVSDDTNIIREMRSWCISKMTFVP